MRLLLLFGFLAVASAAAIEQSHSQSVPVVVSTVPPTVVSHDFIQNQHQFFPQSTQFVPHQPLQTRNQFVIRTIQVLEPVPFPMQHQATPIPAPITQVRESFPVKGHSSSHTQNFGHELPSTSMTGRQNDPFLMFMG